MNRRIARDAIVVIGGRICFVGLWFIALLMVYRGLGADEAGLAQAGAFTVAIACVKIASGCIIDPGDVALMRRAPTLLGSDRPAAYRLLRTAFAIRLAATLVVAAAMLMVAAGLGPAWIGGDLAPLMGLIAAAILADMLLRSVVVVLQAEERFVPLVLLEGLMQVLRFASILALWATGTLTVGRILACYAAASFIAAVVGGLALLPRGLFASAAIGRAELSELFGFLKWMAPAMVLAAVNERLDVLMVYNVSGADAAGLYGAMLTLALVPDLVAASLGQIAQPRVARMRAEGGYAATMRRILRISLPLAALAWLACLALAGTLIPWVLGARYAAAVPIFLWVAAGTLFWLAVVPLPMSMVAVHAPERIAVVTMGQSAIIVFGSIALLPQFGPTGMAAAVCAMRVGVALALLAQAHRMVGTPRADAPAAGGDRCASSGP